MTHAIRMEYPLFATWHYNQHRITYNPQFSHSLPFITYTRGTARACFASLSEARRYLAPHKPAAAWKYTP